MSAEPTDKDRERARVWAESEDAHAEDAVQLAFKSHAQGQADKRTRIVAALRERCAQLLDVADEHPLHRRRLEAESRALRLFADALESGEL